MSNEDWQDYDKLDDEALTMSDSKFKSKGKERKRKWREIEAIKDQRRLRRDIADLEQYAFNG